MIDPTRRSHEENARHDELELEHAMGVRRQCASCHGSGMVGRRVEGGLMHNAPPECTWCGGLGHVDPEHPLANSTLSRLDGVPFITIDEAREQMGL